jgi:hypothetical protein
MLLQFRPPLILHIRDHSAQPNSSIRKAGTHISWRHGSGLSESGSMTARALYRPATQCTSRVLGEGKL